MGIWLIISVVVVIAAPGLARRLGEGLARREGLSSQTGGAEEGKAVICTSP